MGVDTLLQYGGELEARDTAGNTPLLLAARLVYLTWFGQFLVFLSSGINTRAFSANGVAIVHDIKP